MGAADARPGECLEPAEPTGPRIATDDLVATARRLLAGGPLPVKQLGEQLAEAFPDTPAAALAHVARERVPMVQVPPRGMWKRSGGVVYQTVEDHLGAPMRDLDLHELVRRYLRAFGPATAADMTTWSRVTRLGPVFAAMKDELVAVECADGRTRWDVPGAPYADGGDPAPVRLLGTYDNLWLSRADREVVAPADVRPRWMGVNGGVASTIFVDGFMAGLWSIHEGRVVTDLFATPTRGQRTELADEVQRVEELLAR